MTATTPTALTTTADATTQAASPFAPLRDAKGASKATPSPRESATPALKKSRLLYLARILIEETDAEHPLTLPQIQECLEDYGIGSERKALYRDLAALNEAGLTVTKARTRPVSYYLESRPFTPAQMTLLADAIQTSRSITQANSEALLQRLKTLVSRHEAQGIDARIHVASRVRTQNESVFGTLDALQQALRERRDVSFAYRRYDADLQLQDAAGSKRRVRTPLFLVYSDDNYYLLTYDAESPDGLRSYRVDRMHDVMILGESPRKHRARPDFDPAVYERQTLGMYGGKAEPITLLVTEELIGGIVDLFGRDNLDRVQPKAADVPDDGRTWVALRLKAAVTPVLFGRLAQFGGDVRVTGPQSARERYRMHLQACLEGALS